jgi:N-acetylglucosamine repressor
MLQQVGFGVKFLKDYNELNILRYIRRHGPVSRAEIAKKQHFSKAAVSEIAGRLLQQAYIIETGTGTSTRRGGRKPILLTFNQKAGYVIAIEIKHEYARIYLMDMNANLQKIEKVGFEDGETLEDVASNIFPVIHELRKIGWVRHAKPIGIGISMTGLIDYDSGSLTLSETNKSWENVRICDLFEKEFRMTTILENDVKTLTMAESLFGDISYPQNMVNLYIGDGIGAGLFLNGMLIRGVTASAGEVGYNELGFFINRADKFPLLYRNQRRYGEVLSRQRLLHAAQEALKGGWQSSLQAGCLSPQAIATAAAQGDQLACALLEEYSTILGSLCIDLINMLNIDCLIVSGDIVSESDYLIRRLKEKIHEDLLSLPADAVSVRASSLKEEGMAKGIAGLVLEDLFYQDQMNVSRYRSIFK